jgi:hypothetical protein
MLNDHCTFDDLSPNKRCTLPPDLFAWERLRGKKDHRASEVEREAQLDSFTSVSRWAVHLLTGSILFRQTDPIVFKLMTVYAKVTVSV